MYEVERILLERRTDMKKVTTVYQKGVIATIEQFTYADEELRQYVVYTYYDKDWNLLYIGRSKAFYHAHFFNAQRLSCFEKVKYVGFIFLENEKDMVDAKKFYKKNEQKIDEDFIVPRAEMEQRWDEWIA